MGIIFLLIGFLLPKVVKGYKHLFAYKSNLARRDGRTFRYSQRVLGRYLRRSGYFLIVVSVLSFSLEDHKGFVGVLVANVMVVSVFLYSLYKTETRLRRRYG